MKIPRLEVLQTFVECYNLDVIVDKIQGIVGTLDVFLNLLFSKFLLDPNTLKIRIPEVVLVGYSLRHLLVFALTFVGDPL